jgi:hypothetical protein
VPVAKRRVPLRDQGEVGSKQRRDRSQGGSRAVRVREEPPNQETAEHPSRLTGTHFSELLGLETALPDPDSFHIGFDA